MLEIFKSVKVEEDTTSFLRSAPENLVQSDKEHSKDLVPLKVTCDVSGCFTHVSQYSALTCQLNTAKVFVDEASVGALVYMIEIVKKAWFFGQVSNAEFSRFVTMVKNTPYLRIFPYILGCFRLIDVVEIPTEGYNPFVELCTVVLNQANTQCDVFVPTEMLTYAETYYVACPQAKQGKLYIMDKLKTNKIFALPSFWECHLLWSINRKSKGKEHFKRTDVDKATLRQSAMDSVGSVVRSVILTMSQAGLEKPIAEDIIHSMLDKLRLNEQNKSLAVAFLKEYSAEKPACTEYACLKR